MRYAQMIYQIDGWIDFVICTFNEDKEERMRSTEQTSNDRALYDFKAKLSFGHVASMGIQHVIAAVVGIITPAIMVAGVCGLGADEMTLLIQASLLLSGIATLIQLFPIFGKIGAGAPMIMGASFAYVPILLSIGGTFGLPVIFGAQIIGGLVAMLVGLFIKRLRPLFPNLVTGTIILVIGLSLYPVAVKYMAGGAGSPTFGSIQNWVVALATFIIVVGCNYFGNTMIKRAAILIGIICGYIISLFFHMVDFQAIQAAQWFKVAVPMHFGISFHPTAVAMMVIMFIVNSLQAVGDFTATTTGGMDRMPTDQELSGGIMGSGLSSLLGGFTGGLPVATYSQNVGIVTVTRVVNRRVFAFAAITIFIAGLFPKFAAILTTIPKAVVGGATISVFATIAMTGLKMLAKEKLTMRNTGVVGLSMALGIGIAQSANSLSGTPEWFSMIFGSSEVVLTTILAIVLNLILPKTKDDISE
jgi:uracil-xanthine permease